MSENADCSKALKWIRISDSGCICAKSQKFLKAATAVVPISGFESQIVIAYEQNTEISENSDSTSAFKKGFESEIIIAYLQNRNF
ncbi:hypothetical protein CEXT_296861 [Caerostris extrusa]|uniref:Uncharacterized protein n=1 Tax=Caerostris extrusa TaxID=172846 RepID=A0AAV4W167_CAEEX|nr:hypothetical protein CEXT_296861 [Caerostris extrusa]